MDFWFSLNDSWCQNLKFAFKIFSVKTGMLEISLPFLFFCNENICSLYCRTVKRKLRIESTDNCTNFISAESSQLDFQSGARIEEV